MAVLRTGDRTADEQERTLRVNADDVEVLHGDGFVAHVTRHALAREHAARILRHRDRARHVVRAAVAVRRALRAEVVALDRSREALADRRALDVDALADAEDADRTLCAGLVLRSDLVGDAELLDDLTGDDAGLREVARFGLAD